MARVQFYATHDDQKAVLEYFFSLGLEVWDYSSEFGEELRQFRSVEEIEAVHALGALGRRSGNFQTCLMLWPPQIGVPFESYRIELDSRKCRGHTFRFLASSLSATHLYLGGVQTKDGHVICCSEWGDHHRQQTQILRDDFGDETARAFAKLSGKIRYHLRARMAAKLIGGWPILPDALRCVRNGYTLESDQVTPELLKE